MLFALIAMVVLLILGLRLGELRWRHVAMVITITIGAFALFIRFKLPPLLYTGVLAGIDIVLILVIFKGDIRSHSKSWWKPPAYRSEL